MLIASGFAGLVWDQLGAKFTFYTGAIFCTPKIFVITLVFYFQDRCHESHTKNP